ncbi:MAG: hypothetical protein NUV84_02255 [Candidatus Uhrbacteria bacterium]|nr:hypothetical protein [Candidatus Uhrbacteria bacterium]
MSTEKNDPLASLFTNDAKAVDRKQLAELVAPYVSIDKDSKEFGFFPAFSALSGNILKIEILLAAAKARALYLNEPDGLLPGEMIATGIMAVGSAKSSIKKLADLHKIKKDKDGRYFLPSYRIVGLVKQITNANN